MWGGRVGGMKGRRVTESAWDGEERGAVTH